MSGVTLEEEADYARLPFNIFVSDRWDHNHNATRDSQEHLTLIKCYPYQEHAESEDGPLELSEETKRMKSIFKVPGWGVIGDKILDHPTYYDFDDDGSNSCGVWGEDSGGSSIQYHSGQDDKEMIAHLAQLRIQAGLYLLDREAIESGLIKILWLDEHGQVAWENRLDPSTAALSRLTRSLLNATSLV
ncbi:hypothetical protein BDV06DRAFT_217834 [Aspergillus oleicola]